MPWLPMLRPSGDAPGIRSAMLQVRVQVQHVADALAELTGLRLRADVCDLCELRAGASNNRAEKRRESEVVVLMRREYRGAPFCERPQAARATRAPPLAACANLGQREGMDVTIWHNPNCSKSRQALALLKERGLEPTVRRYLDDPPSAKEIRQVVHQLGASDARALVRKKEALYAELGVADLAPAALVDLFAQHPRLIERPVVITSRGARIGRPTEAILEVL